MSELKLELWSNVVERPHRPKQAITKPFVFTMGVLVGVALAGFAAYLIP